jgi:chromosome segregation ATPase
MSFSPSTPRSSSKYKRNSFEPSASPLFSPSAAARYAAQAEQWNQVSSVEAYIELKVDKWLARVFFPNRVPVFERNDETMSYLHALSAISTQRTKEKKALLAAQEAMIEKYKEHASNLQSKLKATGLASDSLDIKTMESLEELVEIGMVLDVDPLHASVLDIAKALSDQIDRELDTELRLQEMKSLQSSLEGDLDSVTTLKTRLEQAQRIQDAQLDTVDEKISEWTRGIKLLEAKTEEYQSRVTNAKVEHLFGISDCSTFLTTFE